MKKYFCIFIILLSFSSLKACLNTYQYKIFPVGMQNGHIITVDVQIKRSEQSAVDKYIKVGWKGPSSEGELWVLKTYISVYDQQQKMISNELQEIKEHKGKSYVNALRKMYQNAFKAIQLKYPKLDGFKPIDICFCNFQKACKDVNLKNDVNKQKDYLVYQSKSYQISVLKDSSYIAFNKSMYYSNNTKPYYLSSTRVYRNSKHQLVLAHLETGTNLAFYEDKSECIVPDVSWANIENSVYQEPVLHHAYGFDVFILK